MMRRLLLFVLAAAVIGAAVYWIITIPKTIPESALAAYTPNVANGETVFNAGGCSSCHAVPNEDPKLLGGGHALKSPFGKFYVPNISPHPTNGIGRWTEAQFVTALLRGTSPEGEHYYPAFPYSSYHLAKLEDARDVFAYIKTLPQLSGRSRDHELPFPYNIRRNVGVWKLLYLSDRPFVADAKQSAEWNRGAYLANGLAHCAECHSPRNALGAIIDAQRFAGGPDTQSPYFVPNITQKTLSTWSEQDLAKMLETGEKPNGKKALGTMAGVVKNTALLSAADRQAIAVFVKSLAPVDTPPRPK